MDPVFKFPASPGTPLFPVSPERVNRQHLPQSPSLPSNLSDPFISGHTRAPSDVQGKVAQFNNLSKEAAQRRRDHEAALQRAVMGREEAEGETRRLKEEHRGLRREIEEGRGRERRVGERLEALMEELQRSKETQAHSQTLFEKEVRRARKEAFKASSAAVKLQEELKTARNRYTLMREEVEAHQRKADGRDQEVFAAQFLNVGLEEELEKLKQQMKTAEDERDTLRTSLKEEELARIAAEGRIPLPVSKEQDEFSSPKKANRQLRRDSFKENEDPLAGMETEENSLDEDLAFERKLRQKAEEQIDFMKMECQFRCCSCRIAEGQGQPFVHDDRVALHTAAQTTDVDEEASHEAPGPAYTSAPPEEKEASEPQQPHEQETPQSAFKLATPPKSPTPTSTPRFQTEQLPSTPHTSDVQSAQAPETLLQFSPTSGTFYSAPAPLQPSTPAEPSPCPDIPQTPTALLRFSPQISLGASQILPKATSPPSSPAHHRYPTTPRPLPAPPVHSSRVTQTVTTTIPLAIPLSPFTPGSTMTREEALEQIRQRRGRARSIAAGHSTPRKQMVDLSSLRRDISAPAGRGV